MTSRVYRRIPPCDPALVAEARQYGVADLHESMEVVSGQKALFGPQIRPLNPGQRIAGQAVTAFVFPRDGLLGHKAVQLLQPGQILVVTNGGGGPQAMFGEMVAIAACAAGAAGVIVESCIRDVQALREMKFPVWSSGVYAGHNSKTGPGSVNVPITCSGVAVQPGDVIVADDDGVICIPPALLPSVLARAKARVERETAVRAALGQGQSLFELAGLQAACDAAGVEEIDAVWNEPPVMIVQR